MSMMSPRRVPNLRGHPPHHEVPYGLIEAVGLDPDAHRGALPAGEDQRVKGIQVPGAPDLYGDRAEAPQRIAVCLEATLDGEHPDSRPRGGRPGRGRGLDATSHDSGAGCPRPGP